MPRVIAFAKDGYAGINDSHLTELLAEREGVRLSRKSVQRILRSAGIASPRRHRPARYRSRRERRAAEGMLLQLDGSRHRWFGAAAPYASLIAVVDDATGEEAPRVRRGGALAVVQHPARVEEDTSHRHRGRSAHLPSPTSRPSVGRSAGAPSPDT